MVTFPLGIARGGWDCWRFGGGLGCPSARKDDARGGPAGGGGASEGLAFGGGGLGSSEDIVFGGTWMEEDVPSEHKDSTGGDATAAL